MDDEGCLRQLVGLEADPVHHHPASTRVADLDGDAIGGEVGRPRLVSGEEPEEGLRVDDVGAQLDEPVKIAG